MTAANVTARPDSVKGIITTPSDDGLFGPESVTWKLSAAPAAAVSIGTAVLVQMLHPRVMWMINQASTFWQYPEKRAQQTTQYGLTTTYGDTATAEHAGAALRSIHRHRQAVDPLTGDTYHADEPDLLMWVQCTIPWAILRGLARWGPQLTPAEQDRYVHEQRTAARLVGVDPEKAPDNVAQLADYMDSMRPKMALTAGCLRLLKMTVPSKPAPGADGFIKWVAGRAALSLLTPEQRRLYGIRWTRWDVLTTDKLTGVLLEQAAKKLAGTDQTPGLRAQAMEHPFGGPAHIAARTDSATSAASPEPDAATPH